MTTPSQPVSAIIRSASRASQMSPLPSTGSVVTACLERGDRLPVGVARVELRGGARVQRDRGRAFSSAIRPACAAKSGGPSSMPMRNLTVTGTAPAARTAARTIAREQRGATGSAAPPPLRVTLAAGTAEVEVDVVDAVLVHQAPRTASPTTSRIDAVELHAAHLSRRRRSASMRCLRRCARPAPRAEIISLT